MTGEVAPGHQMEKDGLPLAPEAARFRSPWLLNLSTKSADFLGL